jgi:hypothetical protein
LSNSILNRSALGAVLLCVSVFFVVAPTYVSASLIGDSVSASLQPLQVSSAVISQFVSPQVVVSPGSEFTGGVFTPNAAAFPLPIQLINSFGMDIDIFESSFRITILHVSGSNTGSETLVAVMRVNLSDLNPSDGSSIVGVSQTGGPTNPTDPITSAFVSSPSSVAIDFRAFGEFAAGPLPNVYDFQLQTTIPEPSTFVLFGIGLLGILEYSWRRRKKAARQGSTSK